MPARIVFDNATGIGRKVSDGFRTTKLFAAFAAHYGFDFSFCNPGSGHEKGNVENKVGFIRRNLFVPMPNITNLGAYNRHLMPRCIALSDGKPHWSKGEPESQLFVEDRFAMSGLPAKEFRVVRWETPKTDKQGRFRLERVHVYSTSPELACTEIIVGIGADCGELLHAGRQARVRAPSRLRQRPDRLRGAGEPAGAAVRQGRRLAEQPGQGKPARAAQGAHGRALQQDLKAELRIMRNQAAQSGYSATVGAMQTALASTGRIDEASVAVAAARAASGSVVYDEPVDLGAYDAALSLAKEA